MSRTRRNLPGWLSERHFNKSFVDRWGRGLCSHDLGSIITVHGGKFIDGGFDCVWDAKAKRRIKKWSHRLMRRKGARAIIEDD